MPVERVDYSSNEEYWEALETEEDLAQYWNECERQMAEDLLELLKEKEAIHADGT